MSTQRIRRLAAVATAVFSLALTGCEFDGAYDLPLPGSAVSEDDSFEVTAEFQDVLNVVPRSPVMVDDVTVGEVAEVDRVGWHAKVVLRVRKDVELPANAIAVIRQTSLLGEKYVSLEPDPAAPTADRRLRDGDNIPMSATGRNPEVEEVLGALSFLLSGGGVGQLATITTELNNVMDGRTDRLQHLLHSLDNVVGTLDDQKADIIRAMESLNNLATTLNAEKETIAGALDVMAPAIAVLADQHDELMKMLTALDKLGVVGTRVIGASKDDILESLRALHPILLNLNKTGQSLPGGLSLLLSFPFPAAAEHIVKGDYANTEIRFDANLESFFNIKGLPINPGPVITGLENCLSSGNLSSPQCQNVLGALTGFCALPANVNNQICKALAGSGGLGGLGGLLSGIPGLRLAATGSAPTTMATDLWGQT